MRQNGTVPSWSSRDSKSKAPDKGSSKDTYSCKGQILISLDTIIDALDSYLKYKERPLRLEIPEAPILASPTINPQQIAASDNTLVKIVRRHCVQWTNEIGQTLMALSNKVT
uniref:Uncharacterized protein n=1 Tax=Cacopsylla melanoneura TaxID=428564 RepID=A0A8D8W0X1_9HEMI